MRYKYSAGHIKFFADLEKKRERTLQKSASQNVTTVVADRPNPQISIPVIQKPDPVKTLIAEVRQKGVFRATAVELAGLIGFAENDRHATAELLRSVSAHGVHWMMDETRAITFSVKHFSHAAIGLSGADVSKKVKKKKKS